MGGGNEDSESQIESEAKDIKKIVNDNGTPDVSRRESPDYPPETPTFRELLESWSQKEYRPDQTDLLEPGAEEHNWLKTKAEVKAQLETKAEKAKLEAETEQTKQQYQQSQRSGERAQTSTLSQLPPQSSVLKGDDVPPSNSNEGDSGQGASCLDKSNQSLCNTQHLNNFAPDEVDKQLNRYFNKHQNRLRHHSASGRVHIDLNAKSLGNKGM